MTCRACSTICHACSGLSLCFTGSLVVPHCVMIPSPTSRASDPVQTKCCSNLVSLLSTVSVITNTMIPLLLTPQTPSNSLLSAFITRHQHLLHLERAAEEEQTQLLNSKCSPKLLEQRGLALGGLGVRGISIGLGGKQWVSCTPEGELS